MIFSNLPDTPLLGVNIDHVATLRNARGGSFPDPVEAALLAVSAGADIITFHLREDRRHIRDDDVLRLKRAIGVPLNFEAAVNEDVLSIIDSVRPEHVCLVPERRLEVTTEGGLDVVGQSSRVQAACQRLAEAGCRVSLFIGPDLAQIDAAARAGAPCIEIHTGAFSNAWWAGDSQLQQIELNKIEHALRHGRSLGLQTNAGHGLALSNAGENADMPGGETRSSVERKGSADRGDAPRADRARETGAAPRDGARPSTTALISALPDVAELHIGHALIGHAMFVGLRQAVADFRAEMTRGRATARGR